MSQDTHDKHQRVPKPSVEKIIEALMEGNARFRRGTLGGGATGEDRRLLAAMANQAHHAVATVLACSDSRVPVELIFDAGIMELFVVRVAGNVIDQATLASLEYGVCHVHTPLLLVLGHSDCGAVTATFKKVTERAIPEQPNVRRLLSAIEPAATRALEILPDAAPQEQLERAIEENVRLSLDDMFRMSAHLREARDEGVFEARGAFYDLTSGEVRWLD